MRVPVEVAYVLPDDDGIRPAGESDACFYCKRRVGEVHDDDCVTVEKLVRFKATARLPDGRVFVGTFDDWLPWSADDGLLQFMREGSSWCATNAVTGKPSVRWEDPAAEAAILAATDDGEDCMCDILSFALVGVIDARKHIERAKHTPPD